jgi:hypothetical protein
MATAKLWVFGLLLSCLVSPTFGQSTTDDCSFQPSIDGSISGDFGPFLAFPVASTDSFTITVDTSDCRNGPSEQADSVWCYTPTNDCTPTIRLTDANAISSETFIINVFTGPCMSSFGPPQCVDSVAPPVAGDDVELTVSLTGGVEYCVVGITSLESGSVSQYTFLDGNPSCGLLPVELQDWTIDEAGAD